MDYSAVLWNSFRGWFIGLIIVQVIFGFIAASFASSKGYSFGWGFLLGISIPLFGSIAVIGLLPEKNRERESEPSENIKWKCPKCNNSNPNITYVCEKCGYKLN